MIKGLKTQALMGKKSGKKCAKGKKKQKVLRKWETINIYLSRVNVSMCSARFKHIFTHMLNWGGGELSLCSYGRLR